MMRFRPRLVMLHSGLKEADEVRSSHPPLKSMLSVSAGLLKPALPSSQQNRLR